VEARVNQQFLETQKPVEVGAVERIYLGLRLLEGRARLEPPDDGEPPAVAEIEEQDAEKHEVVALSH
jgi:hypothetical protein